MDLECFLLHLKTARHSPPRPYHPPLQQSLWTLSPLQFRLNSLPIDWEGTAVMELEVIGLGVLTNTIVAAHVLQ